MSLNIHKVPKGTWKMLYHVWIIILTWPFRTSEEAGKVSMWLRRKELLQVTQTKYDFPLGLCQDWFPWEEGLSTWHLHKIRVVLARKKGEGDMAVGEAADRVCCTPWFPGETQRCTWPPQDGSQPQPNLGLLFQCYFLVPNDLIALCLLTIMARVQSVDIQNL